MAPTPSSGRFYCVNGQARCVRAVLGETEKHRFVIGTTHLNANHHHLIHVLEFNEDENKLMCVEKYTYDHEIWNLRPHPSNPALMLVGQKHQIGLYEMSMDSSQQLMPRAPMVASGRGGYMMMAWEPSEGAQAVMLDANRFKIVDRSMQETGSIDLDQETYEVKKSLKWDPHHVHAFGAAMNDGVHLWDLRTGRPSVTLQHAHAECVRDFDYNPNKPSHFVTAGDDGKIKFWDVRTLQTPLKSVSEHTHWVWCVEYNRFHDQLLISGGSDRTVNLWRISSISSAASLMALNENQPQEETEVADGKVNSFEEHEDSVYSIAWGACDSWIYTSLSYDGRVALHHVPSGEKYKILL